MRKVTLFVALSVLLTPAMFAQSATSAANPNNVSATVANNCRVDTFNLAFGPYDPVAVNLTVDLPATTTVNVFCTKGGTFTSLTLSNGLNPLVGTRQMAFGAERLAYDVYLDAAHTIRWTSGVGNEKTPTAASTSKNTAMDGGYTAFGLVPAGQDVAAGNYFDTVTATVNF